MTLKLDLIAVEAEALAQFLKRVQFDDFKHRAVDENEAYLMQDAAIKLKKALAEQGLMRR